VVLTLPNSKGSIENTQHSLIMERNISTVRLQFVGATPSTSITGGDLLPGKVNYLLGDDPTQWRTNLPTYSHIAYSGLYQGIDLVYTGTGSQLKGTYNVAAGADPTRIRWRYVGADKVSLDPQGNLHITLQSKIQNPKSKITEAAPIVWQEIDGQHVPVSASYVIAADGTIGFQLGAYDRAYPLVIDPTLVYSTYLGGAAPDEAYGIALDSAGNMYVAGLTQSSNFPVQGAYQPTYQGGTDAFVTKLNPAGTALVYSTYLGGSGLDQGFAIDVDNEGYAIVTGNTNSTNFPIQGALQPTYGGGVVDSFATKLNQAGSGLFFSTYLGGSGFDTGQGVAVDNGYNIFVAGLSNSTNFPIHNPYQPNNAGGQDVTLTSLSPTGGARFSTYLGGAGDDFGRGAAVDGAGGVYVTGSTASNNFPVMNAYQPTCRNNCQYSDSFLTKFTHIGQLLYSTFLGGNIEEVGYGVAADASGNAYLTGTTTSLNFPTRNPFQPNFVNFIDAYLSKINTTLSGDASLVYSTYLGGNSTDYGYDVEIDDVGNAYVTGYANSTNFPIQDPIQGTNGGGADAFVTVFAPGGSTLVYSTYLGGSANDFGRGIALDGAGNTYIAGHTESANFPTQNPYQPNNAGARDAFVAKIFQQPAVTPTTTSVASSTSTPVVGTATATPCGTGTCPFVPGTFDIGNHCDACTTSITLPFPFRLYDQTFTSANVSSNGNLQFASNNATNAATCLPAAGFSYTIFPHWDDLRTDCAGCGVFTSLSGSAPNRIFIVEWRAGYATGSDRANFEVQLFEGSPGNQLRMVYGRVDQMGQDAVVGVQRDTTQFWQYACRNANLYEGLCISFPPPPQCVTPTPVNPTTTPAVPTSTSTPMPATGTPTPTAPASTPTACVSSANYVVATAISTIISRPPTTPIPGTDCGSCVVSIQFPFPYQFYGQSYTGANLSTDGNVQFVGSHEQFTNVCLPDPRLDTTIFAYWDDLRTDCANCGIYRQVTGSEPNRVFHLEWNARYFNGGDVANFELRLYENTQRFDIIYGRMDQGNTSSTVGVQKDANHYTQYACYGNGGPIARNLMLVFTLTTCPTATPPPTRTNTVAPTNTVVSTPTSCAITFTDVPSNHTFYANIRCLACRGIVSGYADGTFKPDNLVTRSQLAKIVSNAGSFNEDPGPQIFQDVPVGHPFYEWINRLTNRGYMTGYTCGSPGEPCIDNRPYFRPFANATRAQTAKIVSNAAMIETNIPPEVQTFEDVPSSHPFWIWIERLAARGVMGGYNCGGPGEPCSPQRRAYFRPYNDVTRGQSAKIVANTFLPDCSTP
jgi:hypothetical protein